MPKSTRKYLIVCCDDCIRNKVYSVLVNTLREAYEYVFGELKRGTLYQTLIEELVKENKLPPKYVFEIDVKTNETNLIL